MLLNLSNHPKKFWEQNQLAEAEKLYGEVVDLDFPQIPPEADEELILSLANDFKDICLNILSSSKDKNNAVHIMGELTFSYALINLLKQEKIICIASTTSRNVIELENKKISQFNFVRFRKYY